MRLISCSKCGRIHGDDFICKSGRLPRTNEQALRNLNKWHCKSREIRERSKYLCAVCLDRGEARADDNLEVHHIIKLRDDPSGLLDDDNLICLCTEHHKQADRGEIDINYLRRLVEKREAESYPLI